MNSARAEGRASAEAQKFQGRRFSSLGEHRRCFDLFLPMFHQKTADRKNPVQNIKCNRQNRSDAYDRLLQLLDDRRAWVD